MGLEKFTQFCQENAKPTLAAVLILAVVFKIISVLNETPSQKNNKTPSSVDQTIYGGKISEQQESLNEMLGKNSPLLRQK